MIDEEEKAEEGAKAKSDQGKPYWCGRVSGGRRAEERDCERRVGSARELDRRWDWMGDQRGTRETAERDGRETAERPDSYEREREHRESRVNTRVSCHD